MSASTTTLTSKLNDEEGAASVNANADANANANSTKDKEKEKNPFLRYWNKFPPGNEVAAAFKNIVEKFKEASASPGELDVLNEVLNSKYHSDIKNLKPEVKSAIAEVIRQKGEEIPLTPDKKHQLLHGMICKMDKIIYEAVMNKKGISLLDKQKATKRLLVAPSDQPDSGQHFAISSKEAKEKVIERLTTQLSFYEERLQSCQQAELNFEDCDVEERSPYLQTAHYMKKYVELYKRYCELTGDEDVLKNDTEMTVEPTQVWKIDKVCQYPVLERELEQFLIARPCSSKQDNLDAPDLREVLAIVEKVNKENELGLPEEDVLKIARDLFSAVMQIAKQKTRRRLYCALPELCEVETSDDKDPASADQELAEKLTINQTKSSSEHEVLCVFTQKAEDEFVMDCSAPPSPSIFEIDQTQEDTDTEGDGVSSYETEDEDFATLEEIKIGQDLDSCDEDDDDEVEVIESEKESECDCDEITDAEREAGITDVDVDGETETEMAMTDSESIATVKDTEEKSMAFRGQGKTKSKTKRKSLTRIVAARGSPRTDDGTTTTDAESEMAMTDTDNDTDFEDTTTTTDAEAELAKSGSKNVGFKSTDTDIVASTSDLESEMDEPIEATGCVSSSEMETTEVEDSPDSDSNSSEDDDFDYSRSINAVARYRNFKYEEEL